MRLSEIYTSIQGEGPNVGKPTVFVRFGGCNLRCPGWGEGTLPDGTVVRGCDTIFAVYPQFRAEWEKVGQEEIVERLRGLADHVCITGGEPLLQLPGELNNLVVALLDGNKTIDLFTNGSQLLPGWTTYGRVTVVMDYKMPSSGEYGSFDTANWSRLREKDAIKFVISGDSPDFEYDLSALDAILGTFDARSFKGTKYLGPVWGTDANRVVLAAEERGLSLNVQTHKYIFGDIRGV